MNLFHCLILTDLLFFTDCTFGGNTAKYHHSHVHTISTNNTTNNNNNNNNTTNVNNNNQKGKRQFSISSDGPTISEDDLENLINQSINEWQQRQKSGEIEIEINPTEAII